MSTDMFSDARLDMCHRHALDMCRRHAYMHLRGHVFRNLRRHLLRHVYRHVPACVLSVRLDFTMRLGMHIDLCHNYIGHNYINMH